MKLIKTHFPYFTEHGKCDEFQPVVTQRLNAFLYFWAYQTLTWQKQEVNNSHD